MTAKENARELVLKYLRLQETDSYNWFNKKIAKQCALIAVDEILNEYWSHDTKRRDWWQEVKSEIQNL